MAADGELVGPFVAVACAVADMDRQARAQPRLCRRAVGRRDRATRSGASARTGWSPPGCSARLHWRLASYRYALERLVIAVPSPLAVEAERALKRFASDRRCGGCPAGAMRRRRIRGAGRRRGRSSRSRPAPLRPCHAAAGGTARAASARRAIGIRPGSGPKVRTRISPVAVGASTISRSAAVTSSSSGSSARWLRRHQVELDDAPAGGAVVDRVIGDAVAAYRTTPTYRPGSPARAA